MEETNWTRNFCEPESLAIPVMNFNTTHFFPGTMEALRKEKWCVFHDQTFM